MRSFLKSLDSAAARLRNFVDKAAQATLAGDVFDDAATGQGLLNFLLRGVNCGAFTEKEAAASGPHHRGAARAVVSPNHGKPPQDVIYRE